MTYPAGRPSWIDLATPEPERSRAFYAALFGWQYWHTGEEFGQYALAHQNGKSAAGIMPLPADAPATDAWTVYFASDDIDADVEHARELGAHVAMGPHKVGDQGSMALLVDPMGATFGLWQADAHKGAESREGPGSLAWVEVNTHDAPRALNFYTRLLRADSSPVPGMDYHQLKHGEEGFAGVSGTADHWEAIDAPYWMTYFYVGDVDETARTAQQQGGEVLVAPFDMPYGRMAVLADPTGVRFSVMNPQPAS